MSLLGQSWGRYPLATQSIRELSWISDPLPVVREGTMLPYGFGRSYGDSCLNDGGTLLSTRRLDRFIAFDRTSGLLRCESGVSLDAVLRLVVPAGWFLPTTPGTKFVTVGGAVANDIHGKNHHQAGTFGCHVTQLELLRSDGKRFICSPEHNAEWFRTTVGGLGLTGLITWVEFRLRRIASAWIDVESIRFSNLDEFLQLTQSDVGYEHVVAWVDCLASGRSLGRGIYFRGNHAGHLNGEPLEVHGNRHRTVPMDAPNFVLGPLTVRTFNALYYRRQLSKAKQTRQHYDPFFYPLDSLHHWNRIYGRRGFFQYQFVVPTDTGAEAVREILERIATSGRASFLAVLKRFGDRLSPGLLSFPRPGITLALDFPNEGAKTLELFEELDRVVIKAGGRLYPAKDARMSARDFQACYPGWRTLQQHMDPHFSSSFWRRVTSDAT